MKLLHRHDEKLARLEELTTKMESSPAFQCDAARGTGGTHGKEDRGGGSVGNLAERGS